MAAISLKYEDIEYYSKINMVGRRDSGDAIESIVENDLVIVNLGDKLLCSDLKYKFYLVSQDVIIDLNSKYMYTNLGGYAFKFDAKCMERVDQIISYDQMDILSVSQDEGFHGKTIKHITGNNSSECEYYNYTPLVLYKCLTKFPSRCEVYGNDCKLIFAVNEYGKIVEVD